MKELTITPPEGYEIDKDNSTFEKIVFKPVRQKYPTKLEEIFRPFYLDEGNVERIIGSRNRHTKECFSSKERAEEVLALIQLLALRDAVWEIDGWKPDFSNGDGCYTICSYAGRVWGGTTAYGTATLSFKTEETRDWFLETHRELIEKAKNLL